MAKKFRPRMREVEGEQYNGENKKQILEFLKGSIEITIAHEEESPKKLIIITSDDEHHLKIGSWIMKWEQQIDHSRQFKNFVFVCNTDMVKIFFEEWE